MHVAPLLTVCALLRVTLVVPGFVRSAVGGGALPGGGGAAPPPPPPVDLYPCPKCDKKFQIKSSVARHIRMHHNKDESSDQVMSRYVTRRRPWEHTCCVGDNQGHVLPANNRPACLAVVQDQFEGRVGKSLRNFSCPSSSTQHKNAFLQSRITVLTQSRRVLTRFCTERRTVRHTAGLTLQPTLSTHPGSSR